MREQGGVTERIAILQSNYIPWKGYFDIIAAVDTFVVYDVVQYTKNDWRNRNKVKKPGGGTKWLTVPVHQRSLDQRIDETEIADRSVLHRHWRTIEQYYDETERFHDHADDVRNMLDRDAPRLLSDLNAELIKSMCGLLGIDTNIVQATEFNLEGDPTERLVGICEQAGAQTYLSGPAAQDYLDVDAFQGRRIDVEWMDYSGYPEYAQPHGKFEHAVSVVDLLLCTGTDATTHLTSSPAGHTP